MLNRSTLPTYIRYIVYSSLLALCPWTEVDCQEYITKEQINYKDGEVKDSYLTEYINFDSREEDWAIASFSYAKVITLMGFHS